MRYHDITPIQSSTTHPHISEIVMDPAKWSKFDRAFEDRAEVSILRVDRQTPGAWIVHVGCASKEVRDLLESNW
jgi:hypothetical protein